MSEHPNKHDDAYWRERLTDEQYRIARQQGTERPFSGYFDHHSPDENYSCSACGEELFLSEHKFNSGCGWPAFDKPIKGAITETLDRSHGMVRVEVSCQHCGAHLGHVFTDGPTDTGLRYCINSVSLRAGDHSD